MLECAFCGANLSRRSWNSGTDYQKTIWQCVAATKHGKSNCPHSKGIEESVIEEAFVKSYNILCKDNQNIIENFVARLESSLKNENPNKKIKQNENEINSLRDKKDKLLELYLSEGISREEFEQKNEEYDNKINSKLERRNEVEEHRNYQQDIDMRVGRRE